MIKEEKLCFVEMRTYLLKPGYDGRLRRKIRRGALGAGARFLQLGGLWRSEVGGLNRVVHMWPYESFEERERIGGEAQEDRQVAAQDPRIHHRAREQDYPAGAIQSAA